MLSVAHLDVRCYIMPRCEGRPEGQCPLNKIDGSVHHCQGDLMLCDECERHRFPYVSTSTTDDRDGADDNGGTCGCSRPSLVVEYRTRNREVAGSTHIRSTASNFEQVANLLCAQANSASYPQQDGK